MENKFYQFSAKSLQGKEISMETYKYLKKELSGLFGGKIKWNFTKFLIDTKGNPVKRFAPVTKPDQIDKYLVKFNSPFPT